MKVAVLCDAETRPDTTGAFVAKAFETMGHTTGVFHPLKGIPTEADMYLVVDDGHRYEFTDLPITYWAIDTHLDYEHRLEMARQAETVFAAQKIGAGRLSQDLGREVKWLPLGCDMSIHGGQDVAKEYDICFNGTVNMDPIFKSRRLFLEVMFKQFKNYYFGQRHFKEATDKYSQSRIVLNHCINKDLNMRVFEVMASGSMLLTNEAGGQEELFAGSDGVYRDGKYFVTFKDTEDAIRKVKYYLAHEQLRKSIAKRGKKEAYKHTYGERIIEMTGAYV